MGDIATDDADYLLALDKAAIQSHLCGLFAHDFDKAHRVYRKDAVLERPQFREIIVGRDNIKDARRKRVGRDLAKVDVIMGQADLWVAECIFSEGSKKTMVVNVMEFC